MTYPLSGPLPAAIPVQATALRGADGGTTVQLADPRRISTTVQLSFAAYFIVALLDGQRTAEDVRAIFEERFGNELPLEDIAGLLAALDQALLLRTPRYAREYAARTAAFATGDTRDARAHWPAEELLRAEVRGVLQAGRHAGAAPRGIVAPHLDYGRGGPCYADAYAALRAAPPADTYIILGTNHYGHAGAVVATGKDFVTPLGRVPTDVALLERLERRLGGSLREFEYDHVAEHSIELQVHLLQEALAPRAFAVLGLLIPDPSDTAPAALAVRSAVDALADALRAELAAEDAGGRRLFVIASADLSHVGRSFGDEAETTPEMLEAVRSSDERLLALLAADQAAAFVDSVAATQNATRICSVGCIYAAVQALRPARFRLLRYHQAADIPNETTVSCCAGSLE